ncbi:tetratricopeptide repeat protein [Streptomyces sp. NBC_00237]|uniref:tetratricopeptide repeat protein n=1 Tax=Streptomyces sp. NBC_00237 TaxID=2975687 RepID=UPI00225B69B9|nr:tetratricopeptide repeat protein [Streptomyces sp. NBC_00237]MCX5200316.1 tetratricopeptide repeat protein [Streptomyces sp. NBC_00237]
MTTLNDRTSLLAEAIALRTADRTEEARTRLLSLSERFPADAEIAYQTAWAHDRLGLEAEAVPFYESALAGTLTPADRKGALLGLGSTYRILGRYEDAVRTLRTGAAEFPEDGALRTFLSMALFNTGEAHEGMRLLLRLLAETSDDASVRQYRAAIEYYAKDLTATE